jgi:hypothetical protein
MHILLLLMMPHAQTATNVNASLTINNTLCILLAVVPRRLRCEDMSRTGILLG